MTPAGRVSKLAPRHRSNWYQGWVSNVIEINALDIDTPGTP